MTDDELKIRIEAAVIEKFCDGDSSNGLTLSALSHQFDETPSIRIQEAICSLISTRRVVLNFGTPNNHILLYWPRTVEDQLAMMRRELDLGACLYPHCDVVGPRIPKDERMRAPFTTLIQTAIPQIQHFLFELPVLEYYLRDPKYLVGITGKCGHMSISNAAYFAEETLKRDYSYVQGFALAVSKKNGTRYVAVSLRDLARLTPEHQQRWKTFIVDSPESEIDSQYLDSVIFGKWPKRTPIVNCLFEYIGLLNRFSLAHKRSRLFKGEPTHDLDFRLGPFWSPTLRNYEDFVLGLHQLLIDNIDTKALRKRFGSKDVDGNLKGGLRCISEWVENESGTIGEEELWSWFSGIRQLPKERANVHRLKADKVSLDYYREQNKWLQVAVGWLRQMVSALESKFKESGIALPDWHFDPALVDDVDNVN